MKFLRTMLGFAAAAAAAMRSHFMPPSDEQLALEALKKHRAANPAGSPQFHGRYVGKRNPAGSKLARMAAEGRLTLRGGARQ